MKAKTRLFYLIIFILVNLICFSCKSETNQFSADASIESKDTISSDTIPPSTTNGDSDISSELIELEIEYSDMLAPIVTMKTDDPKAYWFMVSWLKTAYKTPDWTGYYSDEWRLATKQKGIDCSGFTRVMLDQIFDIKVAGGSQRLLDHYCDRIPKEDLKKGDLLFFRAPYSKSDKIVHVGVYLMDGYFVHATSTKSAAEGKGLAINTLEEENWAAEYVTGGRVKT